MEITLEKRHFRNLPGRNSFTNPLAVAMREVRPDCILYVDQDGLVIDGIHRPVFIVDGDRALIEWELFGRITQKTYQVVET